MTNEEAVRLYWQTCWNERRTERLGEVFHDPYLHGKTEFTPARLAGIVDWAVAAFADFRVQVNESATVGDAVITRSTFLGTHTGKIYGLPPTGRPVALPTLDLFFFRDGKVWRYWHQTDHLPVLAGIGAEIRVGDRLADLDA